MAGVAVGTDGQTVVGFIQVRLHGMPLLDEFEALMHTTKPGECYIETVAVNSGSPVLQHFVELTRVTIERANYTRASATRVQGNLPQGMLVATLTMQDNQHVHGQQSAQMNRSIDLEHQTKR